MSQKFPQASEQVSLKTRAHSKLSALEKAQNRRHFLQKSLSLSLLAFGALSLSTSTLLAKTKQIIKEKTMNLTKIARENFTRLFKRGPEKGPLASTDAEFFERYINFAFDENLAHTKALKEDERLMLILGALIATQGLSEYKLMLKAALNIGIKPAAIKEILYQSTPYVGIGKALEFINATNEVFSELNIAQPLESRATTTRENRQQKGLEVQRRFFGEAIDKGNAAAPADEKHIRAFLSAHCFGDFYTRTGLELKFRELLTFVILSALGGADAQVKAHVAGNLNMGNDRAKLIATLTALIPYIGYPRTLNALAVVDELSPAKG